MASTLLDELRAEHTTFRRYLDLFEREVAKYESGESPDYDLVDLLIDYFTSFPDEWHHKREDHVYDALAAASEADAEALYDLRAEHGRLEQGVASFSARIEQLRLGDDMPAETIIADGKRFAEQLRHHMDREDFAFFPAAEQSLDADAWRKISDAIAREIEAGGGEKLTAKLAGLQRAIDDAALSQN